MTELTEKEAREIAEKLINDRLISFDEAFLPLLPEQLGRMLRDKVTKALVEAKLTAQARERAKGTRLK